jgi:hypothetical protein
MACDGERLGQRISRFQIGRLSTRCARCAAALGDPKYAAASGSQALPDRRAHLARVQQNNNRH